MARLVDAESAHCPRCNYPMSWAEVALADAIGGHCTDCGLLLGLFAFSIRDRAEMGAEAV